MFFSKQKKDTLPQGVVSPKVQTAEGWKRSMLKKNKKTVKKGS